MPDFRSRMRMIANHAGYGPCEYYHQVVETLVRHWRIAQLQPTLAGAIEARYQILAHRDRLGRLAQRIAAGRSTALA